MGLTYLTRRVRFSAAHRYYRPDWDERRNREVFGACANPVGHGHNYTLDVTIAGSVADETGFAADLFALDRHLQSVVGPLDHQHLNHVIDDFAEGRAIPSSENLVRWLWPRVAGGLEGGVRLHRLRLSEDRDFWVDYYGGAAEPGGRRAAESGGSDGA
ncbi:MAG: 6-carboxytetrahydropterin synthase [Gemmatimonadota bacterium]